MKKATKRIPALERLAKEMKVLSDEEQRAFIGAKYYYSRVDGSFLGSSGPGNEVLVGGYNGDPSASPLSGADNEMLGKVLSTMGNTMGIGNVNICYDNDSGVLGTHYKGQVSFNYNNMFMGNNNYYEYLSVLSHESSHQMMYLSGSGNGLSSDEKERLALKHQINHESFKNTSDYFKSLILKEYYKYCGSSGDSELFDTGWFYTEEDYYNLLDSDQWKGGFVIGVGYQPPFTDGTSTTGSSGSGSGNQNSSSSGSGNRGSQSNPYSLYEFFSWHGTWYGGWVDGLGFIGTNNPPSSGSSGSGSSGSGEDYWSTHGVWSTDEQGNVYWTRTS